MAAVALIRALVVLLAAALLASAPAAADEGLQWPERRFAPCAAFDDAQGDWFVFGGRGEGGGAHFADALADRRAPAGAALASRRGRRCGGSTAAAAELRGGIRQPRWAAARVRRLERGHAHQRSVGAHAGQRAALAAAVRRHVVRHAAVGAARRPVGLRPGPAPAARLRRSGLPVPQRHLGAHARRFARLAAAAGGGAAAARARPATHSSTTAGAAVRGCSGARRAVLTSRTRGRSISPPTPGRR